MFSGGGSARPVHKPSSDSNGRESPVLLLVLGLTSSPLSLHVTRIGSDGRAFSSLLITPSPPDAVVGLAKRSYSVVGTRPDRRSHHSLAARRFGPNWLRPRSTGRRPPFCCRTTAFALAPPTGTTARHDDSLAQPPVRRQEQPGTSLARSEQFSGDGYPVAHLGGFSRFSALSSLGAWPPTPLRSSPWRQSLIEPDAIPERIDDLDAPGVVESCLDAGPHELVAFRCDFPMEFLEPGHPDEHR